MEEPKQQILITGSTGGLGKELAYAYAKQGFHLILLSDESEALEKLQSELELQSYSVEIIAVDFQQDNWMKKLHQIDFRKIGVLINNAAIGEYDGVETITEDEWFRSFEINIHPSFILSKKLYEARKELKEQTYILNIGSKSGLSSYGGRLAYNTTKFALRGFSLTLSKNLEDSNMHSTLYTLGSMMGNFGEEKIDERMEKQAEGKKYLDPKDVATKILETYMQGKEEIEIMP